MEAVIPEEGGVAGNISRQLLQPIREQLWWAPKGLCLVIPTEKMLNGVWSSGNECSKSKNKILMGSMEDSKLPSFWTKINIVTSVSEDTQVPYIKWHSIYT